MRIEIENMWEGCFDRRDWHCSVALGW